MITETKEVKSPLQNLSYSWGEFYETMRSCDEYTEEIQKKFAVFEALDNAISLDEIYSIIKPLKEIEINWLNSPCLDGIISGIIGKCSNPIRIMIERGKDNIEACKYFLRKNLGVDNSLLPDACREGLIKIVTLLLDIGSSIEKDSYGRFPLTQAAQNGRIEIVKLLIEKGATIDPCNNEPIRMASKYGHLEIVKLLLKNGASMYSLPYTTMSVLEGDVLINACENGHIEIARFLLDSGYNIHIDNDAALCYSYHHIEIIKLLLERGADIHVRGDKVLENTCSKSSLINITKFLLENGANIHARNEAALKTACFCNNIESVKFLIENEADIHIQNESVLFEACHKGFVDIVQLLIEKGAIVTLENLRNVLLYEHNAKVLKILLANIDANIIDDFYEKFQTEINMAKVIVDFVERKID